MLFFFTLFLSGVSSLINQVIWQRAIKIYLGGADAICSMLVVFVFMLGLGLGSLFIAKKTSKLKNPFMLLAKLEISLFVINLVVLLILKSDITDSIFAFQKAAILIGLPLKFLYAASGIMLLILPCSIMGMTMPVASEGAKRQLKLEKKWVLDNMFFINTFGSCLGATLTGLKLLPIYGQNTCLILAATLNLCSSAICLFLNYKNKTSVDENKKPSTEINSNILTRNINLKNEEIATFFIGFVSLGYEMYLYKTLPLIFEPLPYIFSLILALYLFFWSIGISLAGNLKKDIVGSLIVFCGTIIFFSPYVVQSQRQLSSGLSFSIATFIYFLPPMLFGTLFGQLLNRQLKNWGSDVGSFMGLNTLGSCTGIVATTMVGGYIFYPYNAWIFATIMFSVALWLKTKETEVNISRKYSGSVVFAIGLFLSTFLSFKGSIAPSTESNHICYSDPVGITEVTRHGNMIWDGLWHSALSNGKSHIGTNNWFHAIIPILCMSKDKIDKALVIGTGTGITVGTLAKYSYIDKIKTYDINQSIDLILTDFATGTLNIRNNPKVELIWEDARSGLSLSEEKYQLISQQPLYLKQAGSSNLLSEEYLKVIYNRLSEKGVFLVYANTLGNEAQKLVVQKTLNKVFPYCISFLDRYLYVVSKSPIVFTRESIQEKLEIENDDLIAEIKSTYSLEDIMKLKDQDNDAWKACPITITDDCPILEYPNELTKMSQAWNL